MDLSGVRIAVVAADPAMQERLQDLLGRLGHRVTCTGFRPDGALEVQQAPEVLLYAPSWDDPGAALPLGHAGLDRVGVLVLCPGGAGQRQQALQAGADGTLAGMDAAAVREAVARLHKLVGLRRELEAGGAPGEAQAVLQPASFRRALDAEFQRMERYPAILSLLRVQMDSGASELPAGLDLQIGEALRRGLRDVDVAAHLEQHGFALLLPLTDAVAAQRVAKRIHRLAHALVLRAPSPPEGRALAGLTRCTASVGVATFPSPGVQGRSQLLQRAQEAVEHALQSGGDRVVYHDGEQFLTIQEQGGTGE